MCISSQSSPVQSRPVEALNVVSGDVLQGLDSTTGIFDGDYSAADSSEMTS